MPLVGIGSLTSRVVSKLAGSAALAESHCVFSSASLGAAGPFAPLARMEEQPPCKRKAAGSIPCTGHAPVDQRQESPRLERGQCGFESLPAHQFCPCSPTGRGPALNAGQVQVRCLPRVRADSPTGRRRRLQIPHSAGSNPAQRTTSAPVAKRPKASVLQADNPGFESLREYASLAQWQSAVATWRRCAVRFCEDAPGKRVRMARASADNRVAGGSIPPACTKITLDPERSPEWRGSGLLSRPQVDRNHRGPPVGLVPRAAKGAAS